MSFVNERYCEAGEEPDVSGPRIVDMLHIDANNLYGACQMRKLPISDFEWMKEEDFKKLDWMSMTHDQDIGFIVECTLSYPVDLHHAHHDFPLCPQRMNIDESMLSEYSLGKAVQFADDDC